MVREGAGSDLNSYRVTLTGKMPLIHHYDNIAWSDAMGKWKDDPKNKKDSKAGDDRSPAWRWLGALYHDGKVVAIPQDNIMRCLMEGGAMVPVPGGKNGKTFKAQSQSGLLLQELYWPMRVRRGEKATEIAVAPILELKNEKDFERHQTVVARLGFELFLKRAKIGSTKHVRVRPMFHDWSASGTIVVMDSQITPTALVDILACAGTYKGLGDWRPSGRTPGIYGTFTASVDPA